MAADGDIAKDRGRREARGEARRLHGLLLGKIGGGSALRLLHQERPLTGRGSRAERALPGRSAGADDSYRLTIALACDGNQTFR